MVKAGGLGQQWSKVKSGIRGKVGITFKEFEYKEKFGAGASRGEGGEMERGKKSAVVRGPTARAQF